MKLFTSNKFEMHLIGKTTISLPVLDDKGAKVFPDENVFWRISQGATNLGMHVIGFTEEGARVHNLNTYVTTLPPSLMLCTLYPLPNPFTGSVAVVPEKVTGPVKKKAGISQAAVAK